MKNLMKKTLNSDMTFLENNFKINGTKQLFTTKKNQIKQKTLKWQLELMAIQLGTRGLLVCQDSIKKGYANYHRVKHKNTDFCL